jgi:hypothetical protein
MVSFIAISNLKKTFFACFFSALIMVQRDGQGMQQRFEKRNAYSLKVAKPERKRALGRPRHKLVINIEMDLREIAWGDID